MELAIYLIALLLLVNMLMLYLLYIQIKHWLNILNENIGKVYNDTIVTHPNTFYNASVLNILAWKAREELLEWKEELIQDEEYEKIKALSDAIQATEQLNKIFQTEIYKQNGQQDAK